MREIRFRIWNKEYKKFISPYGLGYQFQPENGQIYIDGCNITDRFIINQYTGLKDKNDKGIYEGDRFKQKKSVGTIEYQDDAFIIDWDDPCPDNWNEHLRHHAKNGEVIGNIYETAVMDS